MEVGGRLRDGVKEMLGWPSEPIATETDASDGAQRDPRSTYAPSRIFTFILGLSVAPRQRTERCHPPQFPHGHLLSSASSSGVECLPSDLARLSERAVASASDRQSAPPAPGRRTSTAVRSRQHPTRRSTRSLHPVAQCSLCTSEPAARR